MSGRTPTVPPGKAGSYATARGNYATGATGTSQYAGATSSTNQTAYTATSGAKAPTGGAGYGTGTQSTSYGTTRYATQGGTTQRYGTGTPAGQQYNTQHAGYSYNRNTVAYAPNQQYANSTTSSYGNRGVYPSGNTQYSTQFATSGTGTAYQTGRTSSTGSSTHVRSPPPNGYYQDGTYRIMRRPLQYARSVAPIVIERRTPTPQTSHSLREKLPVKLDSKEIQPITAVLPSEYVLHYQPPVLFLRTFGTESLQVPQEELDELIDSWLEGSIHKRLQKLHGRAYVCTTISDDNSCLAREFDFPSKRLCILRRAKNCFVLALMDDMADLGKVAHLVDKLAKVCEELNL